MPDRPEPSNGQIPVAPNEVVEILRAASLIDGDVPAAPSAAIELVRPALAIPTDDAIAQNAEVQDKDYPFSGKLVLGVDPVALGERDYSLLQNFRYLNTGLQSVNGYSLIANPHATYVKIRSGIQFIKLVGGGPLSNLLVHAKTADLTQSALLRATQAIPGLMTWEATPLRVDTPGAALGRFSLAPDGNVAYCTELETLIWGGPEHRVAALLVVDAAFAFTRDYTESVTGVNDTLSASIHIDGATAPRIYVGSTRPLKGIKLYVGTPNTAAVTASVSYFGSGGLTGVTGLIDGTQVGASTLAQTGTLSFDSTDGLAVIQVFHNYALYFYVITLSGPTSAGTSVPYATVDAPIQSIKDVWDGAYRPVVQAFRDIGGSITDVTLEALEVDQVGFTVGHATLNPEIYLGFTERQTALKVDVLVANSVTNTLTVQYWNGSAWVNVGNLNDGTAEGGKSITRNGLVTWTAPGPNAEFPTLRLGVSAFFYRLTWSAAPSTTTSIDFVQGIPAPRLMGRFRFPFKFQGRLVLMGDIIGNEGHAAEYCLTNAPDVWNGDQASGGAGRVYFGENAQAALTCAVEIYNRFAGALAYLALVFTANQTFIWSGNDPGSFAVLPLSRNIGCPAPRTLVSMEAAYSVAEDAQRNVAMWLSFEGPMLSDASVIVPVGGLEPYFDQNDSRYINTAAIDNAHAWYDQANKEYNLCFPSGTGQVTCNAWWVFDLKRQAWFEKVPSVYPQADITVEDAVRKYTYGAVDTGHLLRLEHGVTWNGADITAAIETADVLPFQTFWQQSVLRRLKVVHVRKAGAATNLSVSHYADGSTAASSVSLFNLALGTARYTRQTAGLNGKALTHRLRFAAVLNDAVIEMLAWGGQFVPLREDR